MADCVLISREMFDAMGELDIEDFGSVVISACNTAFYGQPLDTGNCSANALARLIADTRTEVI